MSGLRACLFAPEEVGCLLVRAGNRWKLWREREGAVELYHSDENETYTAACWACPQNLQGCLVLGCASGRVQAWDASSAELLGRPAQAFHALASGADCSVAALAASATRGTVFAACSGLPDILEIGLMDGVTRSSLASGKTSVSGLALSGSASEWLLSSSIGAPLKLWRLPDAGASLSNLHKASKCLKAPAGGAAHVDLCCFEGRLMALASDGAMQVDFFDAGPDNQGGVTHGKRTPTSSTRVLTCHERVKEARLAKERDAGGRLLVVGHGPSIVACWTFETGSDALVRTVAPAFSVSKTELGGTVLCARGAQLAMKSMRTERLMLVVAHGTAARPSFAQVTPPKTKKGAAVVEALAAAGPRGDDAAKSVPAKQRAAAIVLGPAETAPQKRTTAEQQAVEDTGKRRKVAVPGSRPETAGSNLSLAPVLRQGLRSKDSSTLDKTLVLKDRDLMDTSVSELSSTEAYDLMQECAKRLMEKPMEGQVYCAWMQRVVYHHGTFIRSYPALRDALRPLHDATSSRCASYRTLMYMHGRLHGLVSRGNEVLEREATETVVRVPLLEYVEGDEDLEEEQKQEDDLGELDEDDDDDEDMDLIADDWLDSD